MPQAAKADKQEVMKHAADLGVMTGLSSDFRVRQIPCSTVFALFRVYWRTKRVQERR